LHLANGSDPMSGKFVLDWAIMALSLFNTILLLWLGLTVLLNAERRTWGIWLASGGLLMGSAFFVSHSAILGRGLHTMSTGMDFWWRVGWVPVIALPFAWYLVMLWYAGYWDDKRGRLHRLHRPWFFLCGLLAVGLIALFAFASPLPAYWQVAQLDLSATPSVSGVPVLMLIYPLYVVLCIVFSLDALLRPEPSGRVMGDLARHRARPWLVAASVALLAVSLLVAWVMLWIVANARQRALYDVYDGMSLTVAWLDLIISCLIALSVVFLGQATVSYEVFTGRTLPRRGLIRHWRRAVILAVGYGVVVGWSLIFQLRATYGLLLTALLMTLFYALLSWRSYAEREHFVERLRPFVASQRLYEHLLTPSEVAGPDVDVTTLFRAMCADVLGARLAFLIPLGPSMPLVRSSLVFPADSSAVPPSLTGIVDQLDSPQTMCVPLDGERYNGVKWAVPLWSERGLVGVLLLGAKRDGGLYSQEEIEIARSSGERLMDTLVSTEMARRLMALQRQRLVESQVLDQKTRRTLHDDVLPLLHTAMLALSGSQDLQDAISPDAASEEAVALLADAHCQIADLLRVMPSAAVPQVARLGLIGALRQVVDEELRDGFDNVVWQVGSGTEQEVQAIPPLAAEVLFYAAREAIRNAARHGREGDRDSPLHLRVEMAWRSPLSGSGHSGLEILVEDNGAGFQNAGLSEAAGGQGLALHSTLMAVVGGTLAVESLPGEHTRVSLILPHEAWWTEGEGQNLIDI
jgi:signal transduction histidine kinase